MATHNATALCVRDTFKDLDLLFMPLTLLDLQRRNWTVALKVRGAPG
jgi:hypothetical protein